MTFDEFTRQIIRISLEAPTETMRKAATEFYVEVAMAVFEDSIEDAEKFMKLFSK